MVPRFYKMKEQSFLDKYPPENESTAAKLMYSYLVDNAGASRIDAVPWDFKDGLVSNLSDSIVGRALSSAGNSLYSYIYDVASTKALNDGINKQELKLFNDLESFALYLQSAVQDMMRTEDSYSVDAKESLMKSQLYG